MDTSADKGEKKKGSKRFEDIDDIIDRIARITGLEDFFSSGGKNDEVISWEPEEPDDPEIVDMGDSLSVTLELPDVEKDDIELYVGDDSISIEVPKEGLRKYVRLPQAVAPRSSKATCKNGVLDIIPKKSPK